MPFREDQDRHLLPHHDDDDAYGTVCVHKTPQKIEKNGRKGSSVLIFYLDFSETLSDM